MNWYRVLATDELPEGRVTTVAAGHKSVALVHYDGRFSALDNHCPHQGGPLGEGKIIDGCITCPWHGWQYRPADGTSPPPFTEKIQTYQIRVVGQRIEINPKALPPGTQVEPAHIEERAHA